MPMPSKITSQLNALDAFNIVLVHLERMNQNLIIPVRIVQKALKQQVTSQQIIKTLKQELALKNIEILELQERLDEQETQPKKTRTRKKTK
jgi:hypothetical protein